MEQKDYTEEDLRKALTVAGVFMGLFVFLFVIRNITFDVMMQTNSIGLEKLLMLFAPGMWILPILILISWSECAKRFLYLELWSEEDTKSRIMVYVRVAIVGILGFIAFFNVLTAIWFVLSFGNYIGELFLGIIVIFAITAGWIFCLKLGIQKRKMIAAKGGVTKRQMMKGILLFILLVFLSLATKWCILQYAVSLEFEQIS